MKKNANTENFVNSALALGCVRRNNTPYINKEQKTTATIISSNTGGSCSKNINGQMVTSTQVRFSFTANGRTVKGIGCTFKPQTPVETQITVCCHPANPEYASPCGN